MCSSDLAGMTKSTLSKIENGQTSSPISTLVAVASALGVHLAACDRTLRRETAGAAS